MYISHDSAVGIVTGYGMDRRGIASSNPSRGKIFLLFTSFRPVLRPTLPPIIGTGDPFSVGKAVGA
jgi:hypothetical protein